jgi:CheY-like chemotaxis protein
MAVIGYHSTTPARASCAKTRRQTRACGTVAALCAGGVTPAHASAATHDAFASLPVAVQGRHFSRSMANTPGQRGQRVTLAHTLVLPVWSLFAFECAGSDAACGSEQPAGAGLQAGAMPHACYGAAQRALPSWNVATFGRGGDNWDGPPALPGLPRGAGALSGLRVLVVEDDTDIRELLIAVLADAGAVVQSAESAASGLDAVLYFHPQLVVSDIGMPDEDGYSFVRRVRALGAADGGDIPCIALTAFTRDVDRERALRAGFTVHLGKPIDPIDLICVVRRLAAIGDS